MELLRVGREQLDSMRLTVSRAFGVRMCRTVWRRGL